MLARFALDLQERDVKQLRYQLLTATAALLAEAERRSSARAVLIVHEFMTPLTASQKRERNAVDLDRFLNAVFAHDSHLAHGHVAGPLCLDSDLILYVGKARTVVERPW